MIKLSGIDLKLGEKEVFKNFSLSVQKGQKVLLSAPSGAGKTCLLNLIMGFIRPDSGEIIIAGETLSKDTVGEIRKNICFIGQDALLPEGRIREVLAAIGAMKVNKRCDFSDMTVLKLFDEFSLGPDMLDRETAQLSGGERQRLAYVICKALERDIWLLDEITAGLDAERKRIIMDDIADTDKTVIIASHDAGWKECGIREVCWTEGR